MPLLAEFEDMRKFAQDQFPPLLNAIDSNEASIVKLWEQSGKPGLNRDQPALDQAFTWFDGIFDLWKQAQEIHSSASQAELQQAIQEVVSIGEVIDHGDGTYSPTPKAVARNLSYQLSLVVAVADSESRGLDGDETLALEYNLILSLLLLRSYGKEIAA